MRSKEEILGKVYEGGFDVNSGWMFDGSVKEVFDAMDEYAKEMAIEFSKFIQINDIEYDFGEETWWWNKKSQWFSDEQLFSQFLKDISFTNKKSPMTREQEPKDVRPEEKGKHPVSKPTVDEPTTQGTTWGDGTDENPKPPLPPTPPPQP